MAQGARWRTRTGTGRAGADRAPGAEPAGPPPLRPQQLAALRERVRALIEPVVAAQGCDLEDVAISRAGRRYLVRVTVDADGGIGHDELSEVSRAVSAALDEAEERSGDLTPGAYTLELSSPGVDRPLTQPRHWHRNVGRLVSVKVDGRQVIGRVSATSDRGVTLDVEGRLVDAAFDELGQGRVQVEFTRLNELSEDDFGELVEPNGEHGGELVEPNGQHGGELVEPNGEHGGELVEPNGQHGGEPVEPGTIERTEP